MKYVAHRVYIDEVIERFISQVNLESDDEFEIVLSSDYNKVTISGGISIEGDSRGRTDANYILVKASEENTLLEININSDSETCTNINLDDKYCMISGEVDDYDVLSIVYITIKEISEIGIDLPAERFPFVKSIDFNVTPDGLIVGSANVLMNPASFSPVLAFTEIDPYTNDIGTIANQLLYKVKKLGTSVGNLGNVLFNPTQNILCTIESFQDKSVVANIVNSDDHSRKMMVDYSKISAGMDKYERDSFVCTKLAPIFKKEDITDETSWSLHEFKNDYFDSTEVSNIFDSEFIERLITEEVFTDLEIAISEILKDRLALRELYNKKELSPEDIEAFREYVSSFSSKVYIIKTNYDVISSDEGFYLMVSNEMIHYINDVFIKTLLTIMDGYQRDLEKFE